MTTPTMTKKTTDKQVKEVSIYVTGFCSLGNHENTTNKSPAGVIMTSCPVGGRFESGRPYGDSVCTCDCHATSRMMEEMSGIKFPGRNLQRAGSALSRLGLRSPGGVATDDGKAAGSVDSGRPTVVVASGAAFVETPSGRAARGQLEEQVRHAISSQIKAAGEDMIAIIGLSPNTIGQIIDAADPPSSGAIYAVLKRWDGAALTNLAEKPFRFVSFTDRGKRELFR